MESQGVSPAWVLARAQAVTIALSVTAFWLLSGRPAAMSALFGGMVAFIPAAYFAIRVGMRRGESQPRDVLGKFYQAELGKLLLTGVLFFIGALVFGKYFAPLMLTCIACLAMNWLVLAVAKFD